MPRSGAERPRDGPEGLFAAFQPIYAEHGIATFPVRITVRDDGKFDKKPMVRHYLKAGLPYSAALAKRFQEADAFGFACGPHSRTTLVDVDSPDERILGDAQSIYGPTPLISRTASGGHHLWYRNGGEARQIRPVKGLPVDILGNGYAVAPPSRTPGGRGYEFIQGSLDDLDRLPRLRGIVPSIAPEPVSYSQADLPQVPEGERNDTLWRYCMRKAKGCADFNALLALAMAFNRSCPPPLDQSELLKAAQSAWQKTLKGENRFGEHGVYFAEQETDALLPADPDGYALLGFLRRHQGPSAAFMCTNSLAGQFGWSEKRLAATRGRLISGRFFYQVSKARQKKAALYRWPLR